MYQRKDGDGSLFKNGYKQKDAHPDMRGDLMLDGKEYEIAGWQKSTRNGEPWYSLKVQPKRARAEKMPERMSSKEIQRGGIPQSDDVPW
jgi:hypothetical protein